MLIGILCNEDPESGRKWQIACEKKRISYKAIDITKNDWFETVTSEDFDVFLLKPPGMLERFKTLYDERLYAISQVLKKTTFPTYEEVLIYENKKLLSYFLEGAGIPHPQTRVFYERGEALEFLNRTKFPIVGKSSIGASGSGVIILRDRKSAVHYVKKAFSGKGLTRRFGPNRVTGNPRKWLHKALNSPQYLTKKLKEYISIYKDAQKGYVIFQQFIPHDFEWRAVKIGSSCFAHKKIKFNEKASGTKGIDYVNPPLDLLEFVWKLCEENGFNCMAVDMFEDGKGGYLVNELQTIFGHVQDHILEVDGKAGRYLYKNGQWVFEAGDFNTNESFDLRLKVAIELYEQNKL